MKGIDYGYGKIKGSLIKQAGYSFVCRYLSHSPGKNITRQELVDFKANGLDIILVWETTEQRARSGKTGGISDALASIQQLKDLGLLLPQVVYFAVDEEMPIKLLYTMGEYLRGVSDIIGLNNTGVYGGVGTVNYAFENGLVKYGWQTLAWSHGKWDARAQLRQISTTGPRIASVDCDTNESMTDDFGQLRY